MFLKVLPMRGMSHFGKKGKLSPRFVGPFQILERIETLAYWLALHPNFAQVHNVFHVYMLRKYDPDSMHVLSNEEIEVDDKVTYVALGQNHLTASWHRGSDMGKGGYYEEPIPPSIQGSGRSCKFRE